MYGLLHWLQAGLQEPEEAALVLPGFPWPRPGQGRVQAKREGASGKYVCRRAVASTLGVHPEPAPPLDPGQPSLHGALPAWAPHRVIYGLRRWAMLFQEPWRLDLGQPLCIGKGLEPAWKRRGPVSGSL